MSIFLRAVFVSSPVINEVSCFHQANFIVSTFELAMLAMPGSLCCVIQRIVNSSEAVVLLLTMDLLVCWLWLQRLFRYKVAALWLLLYSHGSEISLEFMRFEFQFDRAVFKAPGRGVR